MNMFKLMRTAAATAAFAGSLACALSVQAGTTDIATVPLGTAPAATVLPNLMFILDDSGSMLDDTMPDYVTNNYCRSYSFSTGKKGDVHTYNTHNTDCDPGDPPRYATAFNTLYYNPQISYLPAVNYDGTSRGNQTPTAARNEPYLSSDTSTKNLVTEWVERVYCTSSSETDLLNSAKCKRLGVHTTGGAEFDYHADGFPLQVGSEHFGYARELNGAPYYFDVIAREYCSDDTLVTCQLATAATSSYPVAAPVRFCKSKSDAASTTAVSGNSSGSPKCTAKWDSTNYQYPRFGKFKRVDIVSSGTFDNRPTRTDCAAKPVCTYAEELQNFANWYSYYRIRRNMMKTSAGRVFVNMDERYRIGFITINAFQDSQWYVPITKFDTTQKQAWFNKLYAVDKISGTPLRKALSIVGRHFAGKTDGDNAFMPEDPVQYSCQRNFALLTTDGYWNGAGGQDISGNAMGNHDNTDSSSTFSSRSTGTYDGGLSGSTDTLADVAMYYYKTDLRTTGTKATNNVPDTNSPVANHQHMVTFTLGLGVDGTLSYRPDYTAPAGDFAQIISGTKNWPTPSANAPTAIDDLWHAAVNGRGKYFSAKDRQTLESGLSEAMNSLSITGGAAAASATSTPNITQYDNYIFSSTYRTVKWDGEIVAQQIDTTTGAVIATPVWSAMTQLNSKVTNGSDTRLIYTFSSSATNKLKNFDYGDFSSTEKAYFDDLCVAPYKLSQCTTLSGGDLSTANSGDKLVKYLRGQRGNETTAFRAREYVLGDMVNSKPIYVKKPIHMFADAVTPDYASFIAAQSSRQAMLYIGANDGMLHAFNAATGAEQWAYVPKQLLPEMYKLASNNYDVNHRFFVDGSPTVMDVFWSGAWRTILVGGLNSGGRGYYALDVTDPINPKALWEICHSSSLCGNSDADMGLSYTNPIITKRASDGKWVVLVASGYNNVSTGDGKGYLYVLDAETGAVLNKIGTSVGSTTAPSGLAKLTAYADNARIDNTTKYVYGGDLEGNVWRFDLTAATPAIVKIGEAKDSSGNPQSITTTVEITKFDAGFRAVFVGTGRFLGNTDLGDPALLTPPQSNAYQQSLYAFKDTGANLGSLRTSGAGLVQQTLSVVSSSQRGVSSNAVDWSTKNGWYIDFNPGGDSPGERVNIDPQLVRGTLVVATNVPNDEACNTGGESWVYQFAYDSGSKLATAQSEPVAEKIGSNALMAGMTIFRLPSGQMKGVVTLVNQQKTTIGIKAGSGGALGRRISWREIYE